MGMTDEQWAIFKKAINDRIKKDKGLYTPVDHSEFKHLKSLHDHRGVPELITGYTVLDVGCHWGSMSFEIEKFGKDVYAVESKPENFYFLKGFHQVYNSKIHIYNQDIFSFKRRKFDSVIALNIFHHFMRKKETYLKFIDFLKSLDINEMVVQIPITHEFYRACNSYKSMDAEEFVNFILKNSCLKKFKIIRKDSYSWTCPYVDRVIYMLNK